MMMLAKACEPEKCHARARTRKSAIPDTDADADASNDTKDLTLGRKCQSEMGCVRMMSRALIMRPDPPQQRLQRWIFMQPVTCLLIRRSERIGDPLIRDGSEFL